MNIRQNNRVLSGMRPTGLLHLGHYHGVLKNWIDLQHSYECFYFVADWHALELGQPIMSSTLIPPGSSEALDDAQEIRQKYEHEVDLVIDGGFCGIEPTTVINLIDSIPEIRRHGKGDVGFLEY